MINKQLKEIRAKLDIIEEIMQNNEYLDRLDKGLDYQNKEIKRLRAIIKAAIVYIETEYESLTDNTRILAILNGDENDSLFKKFKGGE